MKPNFFYKQATVKLFMLVFSSNEDGKTNLHHKSVEIWFHFIIWCHPKMVTPGAGCPPYQHHCCTTGTYMNTVPEVESRTQGSRPRPRTQKKSEAKAKDSLSEDRTHRDQGQECSRPRPRTKDTSASVLQKK